MPAERGGKGRRGGSWKLEVEHPQTSGFQLPASSCQLPAGPALVLSACIRVGGPDLRGGTARQTAHGWSQTAECVRRS